MALASTIHVFDIDISDVDRGVYASTSLRVAQHPSETPDFLVTRVLAYCLEFAEGIGFSAGLSTPDEPAIFIRDLSGVLQAWIDIGLPEPDRLHRASKASPRVAVYVHKDPSLWLARLAEARIHRAEHLEVIAFDREWIAGVVSRLERRMKLSLTRSEGELYVSIGEESLHTVPKRPWA